MTTFPNYAAGEHELWEVRLHILRPHLDLNAQQTDQKEILEELDDWIRKNWRRHREAAACPLCTEEIAAARLEGRNPFKIPERFKCPGGGLSFGQDSSSGTMRSKSSCGVPTRIGKALSPKNSTKQ